MSAPVLTRPIYLRLLCLAAAASVILLGLELLTREAALLDLPPMPGRSW